MTQLKFSLKIGNNILIVGGGGRPPGAHPRLCPLSGILEAISVSETIYQATSSICQIKP